MKSLVFWIVEKNGVKQAPGAVGCFNRYYYFDPNKLFYGAWEEKLRLISKIKLRIIFSFFSSFSSPPKDQKIVVSKFMFRKYHPFFFCIVALFLWWMGNLKYHYNVVTIIRSVSVERGYLESSLAILWRTNTLVET